MRRITPTDARDYLDRVEDHEAFYLQGVGPVRSIEELQEALQRIDERIFRHHRNETKNDFYAWVLRVIGDTRLANELAHAKTKNTAVRRLAGRIAYLKHLAHDAT